MKQLLFLLLFPCLAWAQYPSNGNQKITLGEQTTADGLIYRGVLADTGIITPSRDTSAYIILDTVNHRFYNYNRATNVWSVAGGGDTTSIAYVNTYGTQTVNGAKTFTSAVTATKLNVSDSIQANSGVYKVNATTLGLNIDNTTPFRITTGGNWGIYNDNPQNLLSLFSSSARGGVISNAYPILMFNEVGQSRFLFGLDANEAYLWGQANVKLRIATNNTEKMRVNTDGEVWIGYTTDQGDYRLQINGTPQAVNALVTTSDERFKENITPLNKGLEIVNKLKPVTFNFISDTKNNFSVNEEVGFIAQDVDRALSTETFAKSIVNSADDSEPTSTMGLATQNLIPILVKAIQEQNVLIKYLEQRILILENK
jgi:hypothetical protein